MPVARHQRPQDTFADAAVGDAEIFGRPDVDDRLQYRAARDHQIGAVGADARQVRSSAKVEFGDHRRDASHVADRHVDKLLFMDI